MMRVIWCSEEIIPGSKNSNPSLVFLFKHELINKFHSLSNDIRLCYQLLCSVFEWLSEADYDNIIEWTKNILLEEYRLKEKFYAEKLIINLLP
jgi:hypothetical protein